jgi:hypothetical protein
MKREVDEAMTLLLRQRDEIGKDDQPVGQPPAPEADGEQFLFFWRGHRRKLSTVSGGKTNFSSARQTGSM